MNGKEWVLKAMSHRETEKVPYHLDFGPPAFKKLEKHYDTDFIKKDFDSPVRWMVPNTIKPIYANPDEYGVDTLKDEFGVKWMLSRIDRGSPIPVLKEPSLDGYTFPDPSTRYRFENLKEMSVEREGNFRLILIGDLWERATFMRGMENILIDLVSNRKFFAKLMRGITDYLLVTMDILNERFDFECFILSDDYGSQRSLLMSPELWRQNIKPYIMEIIRKAHESKKYMMIHSCGNVFQIIKDMIEMGLDILHPLQPETMDIFKIKKEYGKDITLNGGLRTQYLLPLGSKEDIIKEINRLKNIMGKGGGYILEPGITVQGDVPLENLITLVDEIIKN
jgi:uroporphyrinogen decarboxylase